MFTFEYFFRSPRELIGGRAAGSPSHRWAPLLLPLEKRSPSDAGPEPPFLLVTLVPVFLSMFPTWDALDDSGGDSSAGSCVATAEAAAAAVAAASEEVAASNGVVAGGVVGAGNRTKVSSMTFTWARS